MPKIQTRRKVTTKRNTGPSRRLDIAPPRKRSLGSQNEKKFKNS